MHIYADPASLGAVRCCLFALRVREGSCVPGKICCIFSVIPHHWEDLTHIYGDPASLGAVRCCLPALKVTE